MEVVSTRTSPGSPTSAGISKDSNARMNISNSTEKNAGSIKRSDILRMVCQIRAPHTADASSSDGSIERKAAASIRNTNGDHSNDATTIIPAREYTLITGSVWPSKVLSQKFTGPALPSSNSQPIV